MTGTPGDDASKMPSLPTRVPSSDAAARGLKRRRKVRAGRDAAAQAQPADPEADGETAAAAPAPQDLPPISKPEDASAPSLFQPDQRRSASTAPGPHPTTAPSPPPQYDGVAGQLTRHRTLPYAARPARDSPPSYPSTRTTSFAARAAPRSAHHVPAARSNSDSSRASTSDHTNSPLPQVSSKSSKSSLAPDTTTAQAGGLAYQRVARDKPLPSEPGARKRRPVAHADDPPGPANATGISRWDGSPRSHRGGKHPIRESSLRGWPREQHVSPPAGAATEQTTAGRIVPRNPQAQELPASGPAMVDDFSRPRRLHDLPAVDEEKVATPRPGAQPPGKRGSSVPEEREAAKRATNPRRRRADGTADEQVDPAEKIIMEIMSNFKEISDIVAAAQVNTGFYGVFCDRGLPLLKQIVLDTSPAAWEYMETAHFTISHPSAYLRVYNYGLKVIAELKRNLLFRGEKTLRQDTRDALAGLNREKGQRIDGALWRVWSFCEKFGCDSGRERDLLPQISWLEGGKDAQGSDKAEHFGSGNRENFGTGDLLLMAELWNTLSNILQKLLREWAEEHRSTLFAPSATQYPEDLYFLEWVSYVMTLGLTPLSALISGSFEAVKTLGLVNWTPPREFGTRQAFLKDAVASAYRRGVHQEAEAKAAKASKPITATNRALAPATWRVLPVNPGVCSRKTLPSGPPRGQEQAKLHHSLVPPPEISTRYQTRHKPVRNNSSDFQCEPKKGEPSVRTAEMVSYLTTQERASTSIGATLFPYESPSSPTPSASSEQYRLDAVPPYTPQPQPPLEHHPTFTDSLDRALHLLSDQMGYSRPAAQRALAASDSGSGPDVDRAIAILSEQVAAASSEKIVVSADTQSLRSVSRFGGIRARFSSQPMPPGKAFGELKPTKKERAAYASLTMTEAQDIKRDIFKAKVYREVFGNLLLKKDIQKMRQEDLQRSRQGSAATDGGTLPPTDAMSLRGTESRKMTVEEVDRPRTAGTIG